jgi:hypothetical protein
MGLGVLGAEKSKGRGSEKEVAYMIGPNEEDAGDLVPGGPWDPGQERG